MANRGAVGGAVLKTGGKTIIRLFELSCGLCAGLSQAVSVWRDTQPNIYTLTHRGVRVSAQTCQWSIVKGLLSSSMFLLKIKTDGRCGVFATALAAAADSPDPHSSTWSRYLPFYDVNPSLVKRRACLSLFVRVNKNKLLKASRVLCAFIFTFETHSNYPE